MTEDDQEEGAGLARVVTLDYVGTGEEHHGAGDLCWAHYYLIT